MSHVLIVGYGNPLRGDDALGWRAAERLAEEPLPDTETLTVHQLTPELAEPVSRAELVIFIDAAEGGPAGEWARGEVEAGHVSGRPFTHHVTPAALLDAAQLLYAHRPRAVIFNMIGESFELGEGLSATVEVALPEMLEEIRQTVLSVRR